MRFIIEYHFKINVIGGDAFKRSRIIYEMEPKGDKFKSLNGEILVSTSEYFEKYIISNQIWDILSTSSILSVSKSFFAGSNGLIVIVDYDNLDSLKDLNEQIDKAMNEASSDTLIALFGISTDRDQDIPDEDTITKVDKFRTELSNKYQIYIPILNNYSNHYSGRLILDILNILIILYLAYKIKIKDDNEFQNYYFVLNLDNKRNLDGYNLSKTIDFITSTPISRMRPQEILEEIIFSSKDKNLRTMSLIKLFGLERNKNRLKEYSTNPTISKSNQELVLNLLKNDQNTLETRIFNEKDTNLVNEFFVDLISKNKTLEKICLKHPNNQIKDLAFNKLLKEEKKIPQEVLNIAINELPKNTAIAAIERLEDQDQLKKIIFEENSKDMKITAIKRLKVPIPNEVKELINHDQDVDLKIAIIEKISDFDELLEIVRNNPEPILQVTALQRIHKCPTDILEEIIYKYPNEDLKAQATRMLHDEKLLLEILTTNENFKIRAIAFNNLPNPSKKLMVDLLLKNYNEELAHAIYRRIFFDDKVSKDDLLTIFKQEQNMSNKALIIDRIISSKHLQFLRVTLDPTFQGQITNRIKRLEG